MYVCTDVSETVKIQCGRQQIHSSGSIAIVFGLGPCVVYPVTVKYTSEVPPLSKHNITPPVCVQCRERARIRERRRVTVCDRDMYCSACRGGRQSESDAELYRATERVCVRVSVCERATHRDRECARKREGQRLVLLYDAEEPLCVRVRGRERKRERERK